MKKIGNIISLAKPENFSPLYNVVKNYEDKIDGIPTLIIGWENAKKYIPDVNILKKQYDNIWWTFKKNERRCDYEVDIVEYYNKTIKQTLDKVKFIYVNPLTFCLTSIKKIIKFFKSNTVKYSFLTKNSNYMFVYSEQYNTVFGISLTFCEYIGIPKKKVIKLLHNTIYVNDLSFLSNDIRKVIGNNTHYIPILYSYIEK